MMRSFSEFCDEQKQLDEGIVRFGSIAVYAARSAAAGKKTENACRRGISVLNAPTERDDLVEQLNQINEALKVLLEALLQQRHQIGNHVVLDTIGHLSKRKRKNRR